MTAAPKKQRTPGNLIASRFWSQRVPVFYVSHTPGDGGVDWGYDTNPAKALPLNRYFARRFAADCRRVGVVAQFRAQS